jgi:hypothetical protein
MSGPVGRCQFRRKRGSNANRAAAAGVTLKTSLGGEKSLESGHIAG